MEFAKTAQEHRTAARDWNDRKGPASRVSELNLLPCHWTGMIDAGEYFSHYFDRLPAEGAIGLGPDLRSSVNRQGLFYRENAAKKSCIFI